MILIIVLCLLLVAYIWLKVHNLIRLQTITFFSGGLGSGKTFLATKLAIGLYKKSVFLHYLTFGLVKIREVYSNYPILLKRGKYSNVLHKGHLMGEYKLSERAIVVLDEASSVFPNQAKKSDVLLSYNIRWFRHFTNGNLIMTDQSIGSIDIEVRRRVNIVYNLHTFRKLFFMFYMVSVEQISYMEDVSTFVNIKDVDSPTKKHFGIFPFRKSYASRYMKKHYNVSSTYENTFIDKYL